MSRTIKGGKGPGYEYWSKQPFNRCGGIISPNGGKHTKRERIKQIDALENQKTGKINRNVVDRRLIILH